MNFPVFLIAMTALLDAAYSVIPIADTYLFHTDFTSSIANIPTENILSFEVPARSNHTFFIKVNEVPATIKVAYIISAKKTNKVVFKIYDPAGKVVYNKEGTKENAFLFSATDKGEYSFEFINKNVCFCSFAEEKQL